MRLRLLVLAASILAIVACTKERAADQSAGADEPAPTAAKALAAEPVEPESEAEGGTCAGPDGKVAGECGKEEGGCNQWDEAASEVASREVPDDAVWKTFKVSGMTCGGCERRVVAQLGKLDEVVGVEADAELGQVRVATRAGDEAFSRASDAIAELGYKVQ